MRYPEERRALPWEHVATSAICVLAALLYGWAIWAGGWGNGFYSAAAASMGRSIEAFLFGCYDPLCLVTVDKPPLAFWPQAVLVRLFGFHGWAVLLPQTVEGVVAVWLLQRTVRRWAGPGAGLLAALVLAITPVTVAIDRDTNPDPLMVLFLVAAAYALTRALEAEKGTRWLLLAAAFVGLGFSTKMLEAWMVVPALGLAFLVYGGGTWAGRVLRLAGAGAVLLAASAWWPVLVSAWPGPKPYIGGSANGTALSLIVGYNGVSRLSGGGAGIPGGVSQLIGILLGGLPGPQRMFGTELGGQISWLLPPALLTLLAVAGAAWRRRRARRKAGLPAPALDRRARARRGGWVLWGVWLGLGAAVLSVMLGTFHPYYTTMLAPAIGAITGAGVVRFWRWYRGAEGVAWLLLPAAIVLTAVWAAVLTARDPAWYGWTAAATLALGAAAAIVLLGLRGAGSWTGQRRGEVAGAACAVGVMAMLLTPTVWSAGTVLTPDRQLFGGSNPVAGPFMMPSILALAPPKERAAVEKVLDQMRAGGTPLMSASLDPYQRHMLDYALLHRGGARIALAVDGGALYSAAFLLAANDRDVVGMGGYEDSDPVPSIGQLDRWTKSGQLRYVVSVSPAEARAPVGKTTANVVALLGGASAKQRERWVAGHCRVVPPSAYGGTPSSSMFAGPQTLYDCGVRRGRG